MFIQFTDIEYGHCFIRADCIVSIFRRGTDSEYPEHTVVATLDDRIRRVAELPAEIIHTIGKVVVVPVQKT